MGLGQLFIYGFIFIMGYVGSHKLRQRTMHTHILQLLLQHRFDPIKTWYRSNRSCHCRRQSSFNAQQNASLPEGPCYYTQQPTSSAE